MIVLAGGFGTRLKSVVDEVPKALAPVGQVPFLYLQIEHWIAQGQRSFIFLLHHQADLITSFLESEKDSLLTGCQVTWLVEPAPMDTGGAVAYAVQQLHLRGDFIVANADTWVGAGLGAVLQSETPPSIVVLNLPDTSRYGQVQFNEELNVIAFSEKGSSRGRGWINAGLCRLNADFVNNWDGLPFSLERITLPKLAGRGVLSALPLQTDFIDIGIPEDYIRFCRWIESGKQIEL